MVKGQKDGLGKSYIVLGFVMLFQITIFYCWFVQAKFFGLAGNSASHLNTLIRIYADFRSNAFGPWLWHNFITSNYWPNLHYVFTIACLELFGRSYMSLAMLNPLYLCIAIFSIWGIVYHFTNDPWAGIVASVMVLASPSIIIFTQTYELVIGLTTFVLLTTFFYVKSNCFRHVGWTICMALSFCCAMHMDRFVAAIFLAGPFFCGLQAIAKNDCQARTAIVMNMSIAIFLICIIVGPFYVPWVRLNLLESNIFTHDGRNILIMEKNIWDDAIFYFCMFWQKYFGKVLAIIVCGGLGYYMCRVRSHVSFVLWWGIIPFLFFALLPKKDVVYLIPLIPSVIIVFTISIAQSTGVLRTVIYCLLVLVMLGQYIGGVFYGGRVLRWLGPRVESFQQNKNLAPGGTTLYGVNKKNRKMNTWLLEKVKRFLPEGDESSIALFADPNAPDIGVWLPFLYVSIMLSDMDMKVFYNLHSHTMRHDGQGAEDRVVFIKERHKKMTISDCIIKSYQQFWTEEGALRYGVNAGDGLSGYRCVYQDICPHTSMEVTIYAKT